MKAIKDFWQGLANFFEHGDLTPFAVVVSVAHYGPVLAAHNDFAPVAWVVGIVIDMMHFRSVRDAFNRSEWIDWGIAILTTAISLAYHLRFYDSDWLLAAPLPLAIAILARHAANRRSEAETEAQATETKAQKEVKDLQAKLKASQEQVKAWQSLNERAQAVGMYSAKLIDKPQAVAMSGMSERTFDADLSKLNGVSK